eukprot:8799959-Lingulodinium_polyedra.AAC.1
MDRLLVGSWMLDENLRDTPGLHLWTRAALALVPPLRAVERRFVRSLAIHTDGAAPREKYWNGDEPALQEPPDEVPAPSWAFVVIAKLASGELRYVGACTGYTWAASAGAAHHPHWLGAARHHSLASEATAIAWAARWTATTWPGTPCQIVFDARLAADGANGA